MTVREILEKVTGLFAKKEEIIIPEEWENPDMMQELTEAVPAPLAVEPTFEFEQPKRRVVIRLPWLGTLKRIVAFLLMVASAVSVYGFMTSYPAGLIFYVPATVIFLDYLLKTRPEKRGKWYMLDDVEEGK